MVAFIDSLVLAIPHDFLILFEIGIMIILAGILAFVFRLLNQPRIPAYVISGIILGPLALGIIESNEFILALSEIGVAFLLFFAGLEINLKQLKQVGKVASITGILEMVIIGLITLGIFFSFGFNNIELLYITLVVAFSSTMVVIKLLSDKDQLNTLHGRIIVGILLMQDIVAIAALTILTTDLSWGSILSPLIKAALFMIFAFVLVKLFKPVFRISAKSNELILIISLAFLFLFAISAYAFGLSLAIGSFFAGVALANSTYKTEIKGRVHPLRDFFGAILFVSLGIQLVWIPKSQWTLLLILILLVMTLKPLILTLLVRLTGYTNRTAFLTGNYLGQSSEFALILLTQGLVIGHLTSNLFSVLVFATIITMSLTGYSIKSEPVLYRIFLRITHPFSKNISTKKEKLEYGLEKKTNIVLFGYHRIGASFLKKFTHKKDELLVIDFNPEVIKNLIDKKVPCLYGDYANPEIIEKLKLPYIKPKLVVSTVPSKEDNIHLIKKVKEVSKKITIVVVSESIHDAIDLYEKGADYVIVPKVESGESISSVINKLEKDKNSLKNKEVNRLKNIREFMHPSRK